MMQRNTENRLTLGFTAMLDTQLPATMADTRTARESVKIDKFVLSYAENGNAARAYRESFDTASMNPTTIRRMGFELIHTPAIHERVRTIRAAAAERVIVSLQQQIVDTAAMAAVDVSELVWIEYHACDACKPFYDADLFERRPLPDLSRGLPPHARCRAHTQHQAVVMLPMAEWPPAARKLYNGTKVEKDGSLSIVWRDRSTLQDQLNRLLSGYVTRSISATMRLPTPGDVSPQQAAALGIDDMLALVWTAPK